MNDIKSNEGALDLNRSIVISNIYATAVTSFHFLSFYILGENTRFHILKPYFLTANSAGNVITVYIWALFDAFTVCTFLLLIIKLKELLSQKDDISNQNQINS